LEKIKPSLKPGLWGAIGGALLLAILGFGWGGWVTADTARKMVAAAVAARLVPFCVGQFNQDSEKEQKLAAMKKEESWQRGEYVAKQGWATLPGEKKPDSELANTCAGRLMELGQ
jgi:hypothetical protein